ncbi:hypothetical protein COLO4_22623 [Corchorus olitorius]|uniref:F-box domain-containing protein n=1 Tax=Corchorus olitorius TaxID=93759 RepID=A0A1R3IKZ8_9ROSI|nr:hypothetical protein COLO4_22623 [Corchorus olitorius]
MQRWRRRIELPEPVLMDILSRLPVKSLKRFRCVCKSWSSSFQTSYFITKHHQNNLANNNLNLFIKFLHNIYGSYFLDLSTEKVENFLAEENIHFPSLSNSRYFPIVSCSCKTLCLYNAVNVALWNPSTREFKTIPPSTIKRPAGVHSIEFQCLGFGFDSVTDDYKVVRFVSNYFEDMDAETFSKPVHQVELYSLKSDSWTEIPSIPHVLPCGIPWSRHHYVNGFYYWQADKGKFECFILSFDMANEKFSTSPLPNVGRSLAQYPMQLLDFSGWLGAMYYPWEGTEKSFDLWVMMNGSWSRKLTIESIPQVDRPLGFWKNGKLFLLSLTSELVLFDPANRELKKLGNHANQNLLFLIKYFESLVPIGGSSEQDEQIIRSPMELTDVEDEEKRGNI